MEHRLVTDTYYSIVLKCTNRGMPDRLKEFFADFDFESLDNEDVWQEGHNAIRDYEGDFEGISIWPNENMKPVYQYIADKLDIEPLVIGNQEIRITCI